MSELEIHTNLKCFKCVDGGIIYAKSENKGSVQIEKSMSYMSLLETIAKRIMNIWCYHGEQV
jgi:hypothetical protein